jgi:hypothetical protein
MNRAERRRREREQRLAQRRAEAKTKKESGEGTEFQAWLMERAMESGAPMPELPTDEADYMRFMGEALEQLGLRQVKVADNDKGGEYALEVESLAARAAEFKAAKAAGWKAKI